MRRQENITRKIIKNIIYPPKLTTNTLTKDKIITNNIFKKCNFKLINRKNYW